MKMPNKLSFVLLICLWVLPVPAQSDKSLGSGRLSGLRRASEKPVRVVEYDKVSKFKVVSRKSSFRLGEMISVDVAILNSSDQSLYFLGLDEYATIVVRNEKKEMIRINAFGIPEFLISSERFVLLQSGQYKAIHKFFIIGCADNKLKPYSTSIKGVFENNSFEFWGRGCLDITKPGKYAITAFISNPFVVTQNPPIRTAVGEIESTPFEITVLD